MPGQDSDPEVDPRPDPARLAGIVSPLRRALLAATRAASDLPDLPESQIQVIRALPEGAALAPSEIAELLYLDRSTISNLLAAMQRAGLIDRQPDAADGRRVLVSASARARALFAAYDRSSADLMARALSALSEADQGDLARATPALERLLDALAGDPPAARRGEPDPPPAAPPTD